MLNVLDRSQPYCPELVKQLYATIHFEQHDDGTSVQMICSQSKRPSSKLLPTLLGFLIGTLISIIKWKTCMQNNFKDKYFNIQLGLVGSLVTSSRGR
jgi:hypothetical protein